MKTIEALVNVIDLDVRFAAHHVLKKVCIDIRPGETVGLVGESGSGKSTLGRSILGIGPVTAGRIVFHGQDIGGLPPRKRGKQSAEIQAVFQDPFTSLNPAMTIEEILIEPIIARRISSEQDARKRVRGLLDQVALPSDSASRFPREFSGGQRQRVAIARALALSPRLIICDEPVSALDLSTQARVLELFIDIQERTGVSYLFITHDLAVVRYVSHRVAVMRNGEVVEFGDCDQVTARPAHDYTKRLLLSAPIADPIRQTERRNLLSQLKQST
ncbi:ABC transporter ATP-binding protein [Agrobacterium sp. NPDC090283]|uniref:ABC transporter ATP-binding protein n=1 Tax=Agrobacterium sp. NPDC090283 TaxID=3363920 RepID=UPI00383A7155